MGFEGVRMEPEPQSVAQLRVEELGSRAKAILPRDLVKWLLGLLVFYAVIRGISRCSNESIVF